MSNLIRKSIVLIGLDGAMVKSGLKTQHRILLGKDIKDLTDDDIDFLEFGANEQGLNSKKIHLNNCDLGEYGDKLIVKEEHRPVAWRFDDGEVLIQYRDGQKIWHHYLTQEEFDENPNDDYLIEILNELDNRNVPKRKNSVGEEVYDLSNPDNLPAWRSSDVMPEFASRSTIQIIDIWAEHAQDIGGENAFAEGCPDIPVNYRGKANSKYSLRKAKACFALKWDKVHGEGSYQSNPAVAVIEFVNLEAVKAVKND